MVRQHRAQHGCQSKHANNGLPVAGLEPDVSHRKTSDSALLSVNVDPSACASPACPVGSQGGGMGPSDMATVQTGRGRGLGCYGHHWSFHLKGSAQGPSWGPFWGPSRDYLRNCFRDHLGDHPGSISGTISGTTSRTTPSPPHSIQLLRNHSDGQETSTTAAPAAGWLLKPISRGGTPGGWGRTGAFLYALRGVQTLFFYLTPSLFNIPRGHRAHEVCV